MCVCNTVCTFCLAHSEYGGFGSVAGKIEIEVKINHEGEVNRLVSGVFFILTHLPFHALSPSPPSLPPSSLPPSLLSPSPPSLSSSLSPTLLSVCVALSLSLSLYLSLFLSLQSTLYASELVLGSHKDTFSRCVSV